MPIHGVSKNNASIWVSAINNFSKSRRLPNVLLALKKMFTREHPGFLSSLVVIHCIVAEKNAVRRKEHLNHERTIVTLIQTLYCSLKDNKSTTNIMEIFNDSKSRLHEILTNECGCSNCQQIASHLVKMNIMGRPPKLTPHKPDYAAKLLATVYNSLVIHDSITITQQLLHDMLIDTYPFIEFPADIRGELSHIVSILNLSWLYFMLQHHVTKDEDITKNHLWATLAVQGATPEDTSCPLNTALDVILSSQHTHGKGCYSHKIILPVTGSQNGQEKENRLTELPLGLKPKLNSLLRNRRPRNSVSGSKQSVGQALWLPEPDLEPDMMPVPDSEDDTIDRDLWPGDYEPHSTTRLVGDEITRSVDYTDKVDEDIIPEFTQKCGLADNDAVCEATEPLGSAEPNFQVPLSNSRRVRFRRSFSLADFSSPILEVPKNENDEADTYYSLEEFDKLIHEDMRFPHTLARGQSQRGKRDKDSSVNLGPGEGHKNRSKTYKKSKSAGSTPDKGDCGNPYFRSTR